MPDQAAAAVVEEALRAGAFDDADATAGGFELLNGSTFLALLDLLKRGAVALLLLEQGCQV